MKTVAIVCEYNPFHLGHLRQIQEIRRQLGNDTAIVAVMSGNYVQRGETAVMHKFDRAEAAVKVGVSLVLELPFPFSLSGAEQFALGAVSLIQDLGIADYLSFGSESGDVSLLSRVAERISSHEFEKALHAALASRENRARGFAVVREAVYASLYGEDGRVCLSSPNDTLAIYYLNALRRLSSSILPHTVKRNGTDADDFGEAPRIAGATHIRALLRDGTTEQAFYHLHDSSLSLWETALAEGTAPVFTDGLEKVLLSHLRTAEDGSDFAECGGGLYSHIKVAAKSADGLSSLLSLAATKKYTDSRIRRAILFSYFGVTPEELREKPLYTQALAMDPVGRRLLAHMRKTASISILTKPADLEKLSPEAAKQATRAYRADSVYTLAMPRARAADFFIRRAPYVAEQK